VLDHLTGIDDVWIAVQNRDFATAERRPPPELHAELSSRVRDVATSGSSSASGSPGTTANRAPRRRT
jgi:hypothetical protein